MMQRRPQKSARPAGVKTRADWRGLVDLARTCAGDAEAQADGPDAELRLASLSNRVNAASTEVFAREAGAATTDAAKAFILTARAFARRETPGVLRQRLAASVAAQAVFLDQQLHQLAERDFQQAHRGRPEVWN
ncbi:hypothetical protein [Brevundimonas nasdae]|uniref:hypothetical protein n=1 Tax=Brevundimonas nasdae TaxID=172043 RepID=UPI003F68DB5D